MKNSIDSDFEKQDDESRWDMLGHLVVFQLKLILDGLRDALLIPISITAGLAGFFLRRENPWLWYTEVLRWGRATDHWIDLFDMHKDQQPPDFEEMLEETKQRLDTGKADSEKSEE